MRSSAPTRSPPRFTPARRTRLDIASRVLAGLGGGYVVMSLFATALALGLRSAAREEAIAAGTTPAFLVFAGCILWAFAAPTATRAWLGIGLPGLLLGFLVWRLRVM